MNIGILAIQGAIEEHERAILAAATSLQIDVKLNRVILPHELEGLDGLVLPGGESGAMKLIGQKSGMLQAVHRALERNLPVFGTCAGAILLSKNVRRRKETELKKGAFPFLDIEMIRNGYGRQADSFSTIMDIQGIGENFKGIFIRAPRIIKISPEVEVLATLNEEPVLIRQGNILASTFHPELAKDTRIHEEFLKTVRNHLTRP